MQEVIKLLERLLPDRFDASSVRLMQGGVSGARLARFKTSDGESVVIKMCSQVGDKERRGKDLLSPHLQCPLELPPYGSDHYLYCYIPGQTVDGLVKNGDRSADQHLLKSLGLQIEMWRKTSNSCPPVGYPQKLEQTIELTLGLSIDHLYVRELVDLPIVINGRRIPSLGEIFRRLKEVMRNEKITVLSHGDEGWGNVVVGQTDGNYFFLDHGEAGFRLAAEPIVKALLWFPANTSQPVHFSCKADGRRLVIDFGVKLDSGLRDLLVNAKQEIAKGIVFTPASYFACAIIYLLREIQWLPRRHRENMMPYVFALALEAAAGLYGYREELPLLQA